MPFSRWIRPTLYLLATMLLGGGDTGPTRVPLRDAFPGHVHQSVALHFDAGHEIAPVWVFLEGKGPIDQAAALRDLGESYDSRAIRRRRLRRTAPGLFDERDLPVWPGYVEAVTGTGAGLRTRSRWLNAISVDATAAQVAVIARLPFVQKIQIVLGFSGPDRVVRRAEVDSGREKSDKGLSYGASASQIALLQLDALHDDGYTGAGVVIGVLDTGFAQSHVAFNLAGDPLDVIAQFDFVNGDGVTSPEAGDLFDQHSHGTLILGTMGANQPGVLVGGAHDASFILAKVEDLGVEETGEEDLFVAGLEFIEANGGDLATSSVVLFGHYTQEQLDGLTAVMTLGVNAATDNGLHVFQAAGNDGHDTDPATSRLLPPADAFDGISIGAVDIRGDLAPFTSDGPTADGRVKPELLSMGVNAVSVDPFNDVGTSSASGTSLATPLAAAAAACIIQKHPDWTVRQLRSALFQTANWYQATGSFDPQFVWGYGMLDAHAASLLDPSRADLNEDFVVNVVDLLQMLTQWGSCPPGSTCIEDINGDGQVSVVDLLELLADWS